MREGFSPFIFGIVMISFAAVFWFVDLRQSREAEILASEVKNFLENHRRESFDHLTAYQQARQLKELTDSPNRMLLSMLSLVIAMQFFSTFFKNSLWPVRRGLRLPPLGYFYKPDIHTQCSLVTVGTDPSFVYPTQEPPKNCLYGTPDPPTPIHPCYPPPTDVTQRICAFSGVRIVEGEPRARCGPDHAT